MKDSQTEELLLASGGDLNAQRYLFETYFAYIMSITLRYMSSRQVAEEVLNDIFLKVFLKLSQYDPSYPFKGWLRKIAINTCIDRLRSLQKIPTWMELSNYLTIPAPKDDWEPISNLISDEPILPVLQHLPPRYRAVFNLYVFEEYSHKEIAQTLGIHEGTSKSNYARAKKIVKDHLEKKMKEAESPELAMALNTESK
ncbi:MAG: RNA polymerase sigma factor [Saprospiraceae bacterium]|nr:RNA polymerase sigma factor [Saprospiraceae bacterium]